MPNCFGAIFCSKSVHMTFIHSGGNLGLCLGGYVLDRRGTSGSISRAGEPVLPGTILFHVPLDILHQIAQAFPLMIPCALVVHVTVQGLCGAIVEFSVTGRVDLQVWQ